MFVVPLEREDALPGNDLEPPLLAALRFDVAANQTPTVNAGPSGMANAPQSRGHRS